MLSPVKEGWAEVRPFSGLICGRASGSTAKAVKVIGGGGIGRQEAWVPDHSQCRHGPGCAHFMVASATYWLLQLFQVFTSNSFTGLISFSKDPRCFLHPNTDRLSHYLPWPRTLSHRSHLKSVTLESIWDASSLILATILTSPFLVGMAQYKHPWV